MYQINDHFLRLRPSYLFSEIAHRVAAFREQHPEARIIRLGIGDVTRPLCPAVIQALHRATDEMAQTDTFRGYGPEQGYDFLRQAIVRHHFEPGGLDIEPDEVFINDGAKSDTGNFGDILSLQSTVCMTDPIYPVYIDSNIMSGRTGQPTPGGGWERVEFCPCTAENGFEPQLPSRPASIIYLCYPNNPTGTTLRRDQLQRWVDYALEHQSLLLFDAAYEAYIREPEVPHSIYELPGATQCAVEFHSFSKTAGFTGLRCGFTVVPRGVSVVASDGERHALRDLWLRRQCTKFNGTPYIVQRAAEAVYSPLGWPQVLRTIDYYMGNADLMRESLQRAGFTVYGGINAPYLWLATPQGYDSWQFFQHLLEHYHIVSTPGVGFGPSGEGYVRLTAFGSRQDCQEAMQRITSFDA